MATTSIQPVKNDGGSLDPRRAGQLIWEDGSILLPFGKVIR